MNNDDFDDIASVALYVANYGSNTTANTTETVDGASNANTVNSDGNTNSGRNEHSVHNDNNAAHNDNNEHNAPTMNTTHKPHKTRHRGRTRAQKPIVDTNTPTYQQTRATRRTEWWAVFTLVLTTTIIITWLNTKNYIPEYHHAKTESITLYSIVCATSTLGYIYLALTTLIGFTAMSKGEGIMDTYNPHTITVSYPTLIVRLTLFFMWVAINNTIINKFDNIEALILMGGIGASIITMDIISALTYMILVPAGYLLTTQRKPKKTKKPKTQQHTKNNTKHTTSLHTETHT